MIAAERGVDSSSCEAGMRSALYRSGERAIRPQFAPGKV